MPNPVRTESDIQDVRIAADMPGIAGWAVTIRYTDGQCASFSVDPDPNKQRSMLTSTAEAIQKQLAGSSNCLEAAKRAAGLE